MAGRPTKQGLEYFPLDVDFFDDEKVELVSAGFGAKGELIILYLLCRIYRNGYYLDWNEDVSKLLAKRVGHGIAHSLVSDVVNELAKRDFFNKTIFSTFGIITSRGIQKRYVRATADRKEVEINRDYWLVDLPKNAIFPNSPPINSISPAINPIKPPTNAQSRVKERRVKQSKEDRDNKLSLSVTSAACATAEEREEIFKIFFFKNFISPEKEVDRFCSHYAATGWRRAGGQKITDRIALAKNWTPEQKDSRRFPVEVFALAQGFYKNLYAMDAPGAALFIRDIMKIEDYNGSLWFGTRSQELIDLLRANIGQLRTLTEEWLPGKTVKIKLIDY